MTRVVVGVAIALAFGLLAMFGERIGAWLSRRRLSRHTCHTTCRESWSCKCGCRDGLYGWEKGTRCWLCGTQYAGNDEASDEPHSSEHVNVRVSDTTHEMPAPRGFTSWGWERDREFRKTRRALDSDEQ